MSEPVDEVEDLVGLGATAIRKALDLLQEHYAGMLPRKETRGWGLGRFKPDQRKAIANSHVDLDRVEARLNRACLDIRYKIKVRERRVMRLRVMLNGIITLAHIGEIVGQGVWSKEERSDERRLGG